ncbi:MAG: hypothetical protein R3F37_03415 [Candidatus Competibacteraceae bacterium]
MTIVEGTYNGQLDKSLYEKIHFTGSINPGMSGGPTINRDGAVVGVNVWQAISGFSGAAYVISSWNAPMTARSDARFHRLLRDQLLANQDAYIHCPTRPAFRRSRMEPLGVPGRLAWP